MATTDTLSTADRIAMGVGGGLILVGLVVMGVLETLIGNPAPIPQTNEAGEVVATTTFDPTLRASIIALGFLVWFGYALYKTLLAGTGADSGTPSARETVSD